MIQFDQTCYKFFIIVQNNKNNNNNKFCALLANPFALQIQLKWIITSIIWITAVASAIMTYFEMKEALRFQIKFKVHDKGGKISEGIFNLAQSSKKLTLKVLL